MPGSDDRGAVTALDGGEAEVAEAYALHVGAAYIFRTAFFLNAATEGNWVRLRWIVYGNLVFTGVEDDPETLATLAGRGVAVLLNCSGDAAAMLSAVLSWPAVVGRYAHPDAWRLLRIPWKEALRLRPDLWDRAAALRGHAGWPCAQVTSGSPSTACQRFKAPHTWR